MFLIAKVIGLMLVVGIPTTIGGAQLYLKNKKISAAQNEVVQAIQKTAVSIQTTQANFNKEITRIATEKNNLATTKEELTYKPVDIQVDIKAMDAAKSDYETKHAATQASISTLVTTHGTTVEATKTAIEKLWSEEKTRVETLKNSLDTKIAAVKKENEELQKAIDTAKESIEKTINEAFFNPATVPP